MPIAKLFLAFAMIVLLMGRVYAAPSSDTVARQIDRLIASELELSPGELAPRTGDVTFLRRVHLDLIGTIPSPDKVARFVANTDDDKRGKLVRQLLKRPEFGATQARYWRDVILSRRLEDRALLVSPQLVDDLSKWINAGRGWDEIAQEFITATGKVSENGSTAIIVAQEGRTEEIAAEVSRVFLGIQIQCAQCHDHPWDNWKREQFHELAAFFPRVGARPLPRKKGPDGKPKKGPPEFVVIANDRPERKRFRKVNNANRRGKPEHYMPDLEHPEKPGEKISPQFFLTSLQQPIGTTDAIRRGTLAQELTKTDWFATALVNRVWSELVGEGFYEPVDDLGPYRKASAPKAVRRLASAFESNDYDLKWLYRTILATDAYQRESRPRHRVDEKPFTANVVQPLRGDQMFDVLIAALDVDERKLRGVRAGAVARRPGGMTPRMMVASAFGYDPSDPRESITATIPQALARMNLPQLNRAVRAGRGTMLSTLLAENQGDEDAMLDQLYLRTLSRTPTEEERTTATDYLVETHRKSTGYEDLLWALLNSAEFSHRR